MTILNVNDTTQVLENRFSFDFLRAKLTQKIEQTPVEYIGPASVTQQSDGSLKLKLYHVNEAAFDLLKEISSAFGNSGLTPGKILEDQHYFDFEGIDLHGAKWTSSRIWLSGNLSLPTNGKIITAELSLIENEQECTPMRSARAEVFIPGTYRFPFNKSANSEGILGTSVCEIKIAGQMCSITNYRSHLKIGIDLTYDVLPDEYLDLLLEGLGIGVGSILQPKFKKAVHSGKYFQVIYSRNSNLKQTALPPPIPTNQPHNADSLENFVCKYVQTIGKRHSFLAGYWFRVLTAFSEGVENRALVLTTAIEGLLKTYFKERGKPDPNFLQELIDAEPLVKSMLMGERAKGRLLNTLGNAKRPTPKNALFALKEAELVSKELIDLWSKLRNKSAHADELSLDAHELQAFIDEIHGCLELFYRLVLQHIGYSGVYVEYSKAGWPEGIFNSET